MAWGSCGEGLEKLLGSWGGMEHFGVTIGMGVK